MNLGRSTAEVGTRERRKSDLHAIFMDEVLKKILKTNKTALQLLPF